MVRPTLGISAGDPAGIGPEICVKVLARPEIYQWCIPVLYADRQVLKDALALTGNDLSLRPVKDPRDAAGTWGTIDFVDAGVIDGEGQYAYGAVGAKSGEAAFQYVVQAVKDALAGFSAGVVTGPISKEAINLAGRHYAGHTEIFAEYTGARNYGMLLSGGGLNVIHVTTHVSLRQACDLITRDRVLSAIRLADLALRLMGSERRRIAVAALNPHASEHGLFGDEEERSIIPAIRDASIQGLDVTGPLPPDTVFVRALGGEFDVVAAMYHDQGHIPLKLRGFSLDAGRPSRISGVNTTIGLPIIRTSVDHGTAFDKAGKNLANEESLVDAVKMAVTFAQNRERLSQP
ncbi:MAG: 4-hydroxythreonine-4-phosphate dehydrogenase PdxA [Treponema sp.]|jgi:4-hydroxythreonine-4-phosphate dehydrogenase|nr:4-hydroxythreonine-4-phosphate dehydrogenase PdxA [Treponema sp.]